MTTTGTHSTTLSMRDKRDETNTEWVCFDSMDKAFVTSCEG